MTDQLKRLFATTRPPSLAEAYAWPPEFEYRRDGKMRLPHASTPMGTDRALVSFGKVAVDKALDKQRRFPGDCWALTFLLLCRELAQMLDPEGLCRDRYVLWNDYMQPVYVKRERCHLEGANFSTRDLRCVHFAYADLEDTYFHAADVSDANFYEASLKNADFGRATAKRTNFIGVRAMQANFTMADLSGALCQNANLEAASLSMADLTGADLHQAILQRADVRRAKGIVFDETRIRDIQIEGDAPDEWSRLRRAYTGPWFFVHLTLLGCFIAPYMAKLVALTAAGNYWELLRDRGLVSEEVGRSEVAAWKVLFGFTEAWWVPLMAAILLLYNVLRGLLTLRVGMLRDMEERSGMSPALSEYRGTQMAREQTWSEWVSLNISAPIPIYYKRLMGIIGSLIDFIGLWKFHTALRVLLWIALLSFVYHAIHWILTVQVPNV